MNAIKKIFDTEKPIIGMIHIGSLLGTKDYKGMDYLMDSAKKDIDVLQKGGIDGILIENWKEESVGEFVSVETAVSFAWVVSKIVEYINVPFGINVLNNDYKVALSLAVLTNADFIQLDVFVDDVISDFKYNVKASKNHFEIKPKPEKIKEYAIKVGAVNFPIFAFIQPKHYKILDTAKTIEKSAKEALEAGASALLVTKETGIAPTLDLISRAKKVSGSIPVGIGSGFSVENAKEYLTVADFAVVGTSLKRNKVVDNPVDKSEVSKLMKVSRKYSNGK